MHVHGVKARFRFVADLLVKHAGQLVIQIIALDALVCNTVSQPGLFSPDRWGNTYRSKNQYNHYSCPFPGEMGFGVPSMLACVPADGNSDHWVNKVAKMLLPVNWQERFRIWLRDHDINRYARPHHHPPLLSKFGLPNWVHDTMVWVSLMGLTFSIRIRVKKLPPLISIQYSESTVEKLVCTAF